MLIQRDVQNANTQSRKCMAAIGCDALHATMDFAGYVLEMRLHIQVEPATMLANVTILSKSKQREEKLFYNKITLSIYKN